MEELYINNSKPPTHPSAPQAIVPTRNPKKTERPEASVPPNIFINVISKQLKQQLSSTDKSMPPVIITIVMPIAIIAITTILSTIATKLDFLRSQAINVLLEKLFYSWKVQGVIAKKFSKILQLFMSPLAAINDSVLLDIFMLSE